MMAVPNSGWIHSCPVGEYLAFIACTCKQLDECHAHLLFTKFLLHAVGYGLASTPGHPLEEGRPDIDRLRMRGVFRILSSTEVFGLLVRAG